MFEARLISRHRALYAVLALVLSSLICCAMLIARRIVAGEMKFIFLPGNLLLAWIPLLFALAVYALRARRSRRWGLLAGCAVLWFLFYPNAPYLITDIVHIKTRAPIPRWFDIVLMVSFAWTGLFLGNLSLYLMQEVVRAWRGAALSWVFTIAMLALGALGVFVGRFWRWNSWQVVTHPFGLASDAFHRLGKMPPWELGAFCVTFFSFSLLTYVTLYTLTHLHGYLDSGAASEEGKSRLP